MSRLPGLILTLALLPLILPVRAEQSKTVSGSSPAAPSGTPAQTAPAPGGSALSLHPEEVLAAVGRTVDWYHHVSPLAQLPVTADEGIARDRLHEQALTALQLSFDFGRACAALLGDGGDEPGRNAGQSSQGGGQLDQAESNITQRIAMLRSRLSALDAQLPRAPPRERRTLETQRADVKAALDLADEVRSTIQQMQRFASSALGDYDGQRRGLSAQLAELERSVPEARHVTLAATAGSSAVESPAGGTVPGGGGRRPAAVASGSNAPSSRPESAGVIALASEWFALRGIRQTLTGALKETAELLEDVQKTRGKLAGAVTALIQTDLATAGGADPARLATERQALEADAARFKQLSTALVPLGEQGLTLEAARTTLQEWRNAIAARTGVVARFLLLRLALLVGSVLIVLGISELWRRATFRYLHDTRRRRQFLLLRRIAVGIALTVVVVFGLVSEVGSLATYVGFVTAGLAVALQNVILAVVAYFFLIGRYGVRVGDRITLAGVTGRVVDIGLLRINLMELAGADLHATGRVVVLSNAVLFQPTALFKQIPGADYLWHAITLTVAAPGDVQEAHRRLKRAADGVYQGYRERIERQHALMQQFVDFDTSVPAPEVRVHVSGNGLECLVRYPVEPESSAVDQQMLTELRTALESDGRFKLADSGSVTLKWDA